MERKLFFAGFLMFTMFAGGAVSHAVNAMQSQTTNYQSGDQSTANNEGAGRTKQKKSKVKKAADDVGKGTEDTGKEIGKGGEKVGEGVAKGTEKGAEDVGKVTAKGVKKTGKGIKKIAKP